MRMKRAIALGVVGCMLLGSAVLASPVAAESTAMIIPDNAAITAEQDSQFAIKVIEEKNDLVEIDIKYPVISGLGNAALQQQINEFIVKHITEAKDDIEVQAAESAREAQQNGWPIRTHQLFIESDLKTSNEAFLSFTITYYTYTGGANGMTVVSCFNIDKKANKPIHLTDLFPTGADYKAVINSEITKQIELRSQDENQMFFEGGMGFKGISDSQDFYVKDNELVIIFPKYEIAPGAMGIPEFAMNLTDLSNRLAAKNDGKIVIEGLEVKTVLNAKNQVLIPLRLVGEKLGYTVDWDDQQRSVQLTKGQACAKLKIDDNIYIANHKIPYILEAAPVIINDRTYVPVSFLETVLLYKL